DPDELKGGAHSGGEVVGALGEHASDGRADDSASEEGDPQGGHRRWRAHVWCSLVSTSWVALLGSADVEGEEVLDGLTPHDQSGASIAHCHHWGSRGVVVLAGQPPTVC